MLQHRDVVRVILDLSDVRNGQAVLIFDRAIQGDPQLRLRHIFSAGPYRDHVIVLLDQIGDLVAG